MVATAASINGINNTVHGWGLLKRIAAHFIQQTQKGLISGPIEDLHKDLQTYGQFALPKLLYTSVVDAGLSRIVCDTVGSVAIELFSGRTSIFGVKLPHIPAPFACQLPVNFLVKVLRALTNKINPLRDTAESDHSEAVQRIREIMDKTKWVQWVNKANDFFSKNIKPYMDSLCSKVLGIEPEKIATNELGQEIVVTPAKANLKQFSLVALASFGITSLTPGLQAMGFEEVASSKGVKRFINSVLAIGVQYIGRFESELFKNVISIARNGFNFDACFRLAWMKKMLGPALQYSAELLATLTSSLIAPYGISKFLNGAVLATLFKIPTGMISSFLSAGLSSIASKIRTPADWLYLGHKLWKPVSDFCSNATRKIFTPVEWIYNALGFFPKEIRKEDWKPFEAFELPEHINAQFESMSRFDMFKLIAQKFSYGWIVDSYKLLKSALESNGLTLTREAHEDGSKEAAIPAEAETDFITNSQQQNEAEKLLQHNADPGQASLNKAETGPLLDSIGDDNTARQEQDQPLTPTTPELIMI